MPLAQVPGVPVVKAPMAGLVLLFTIQLLSY